MKTAPLVSIGMIFKNEERCIERCLRSLEPLRRAVPCELIMADTGAEDGSREIAERYADEVFDFAWIDDFAAARNAVMDRCRGKWYFSIDCDEWLHEDIAELAAFLRTESKANHAFVVVRNYFSAELEQGDVYKDFHAVRLIRMSTGQRYVGAIHESCPYTNPVARLTHTILHHDGYFHTDPEAAKKKMQRNLRLLRQKLRREPRNLLLINQCIESGSGDADLMQYIRTGVELVEQKAEHWEVLGPVVMAHAVQVVHQLQLPELAQWDSFAREHFPDSIFTRVDLNYTAFRAAHDDQAWEEAIRCGEGYREGLRALRADPLPESIAMELGLGSVTSGASDAEYTVRIGLANAYQHTGQDEKALAAIAELDGGRLTPGQVRNAVVVLCQLHAAGQADTAPALAALYEQLGRPVPGERARAARLAAFNEIAAASFTRAYRQKEREDERVRRPAYTALAALDDVCEAGRGAKIMMTIDPAGMRPILARVEDWQALPIEALEYALREGVEFPLPEKPLPVEVLDGLAARLTHNDNPARQMTLALPEDAEFESLQSLCWAQALALAALRSFDWSLGKKEAPASKFACPEKKKEEDKPGERPEDTPETGLALLRAFARLEAAALPALYAPGLLTGQNAALLPPMHRWGFYCAQAFRTLDAGQPQEYLAVLRRGLAACPGQKDLIQFLLDRFLEDARPKASPELLALAEKVRGILAAYGPDHPAARAIRESDAYKQVAWIIETTPGLPVQ